MFNNVSVRRFTAARATVPRSAHWLCRGTARREGVAASSSERLATPSLGAPVARSQGSASCQGPRLSISQGRETIAARIPSRSATLRPEPPTLK
ncbi:unnamed protein product [Lampetra planeri]